MTQRNVARRLAAVLCADVAGYSRLTGRDEEGTHKTVSALIKALSACIGDHRGRVVKLTGDGVLAEFASVVDAVTCAIAFQDDMTRRNAGVADDGVVVFRIGINLGDVIVEDDDIFGDGVNVAARLEALAQPGGICISGTVHDQLAGKLDAPFSDLGPRELKNIARPVRVWGWRGRDTAPQDTELAPPPLPDKPSIAVLPFDNMSGDPEQEYFSDGVTEDIITALSNVRSFLVIARNSSFTYKGRAVDVKQVGRELGVHYVLEGSVRKAGGRVRVTAQLLDAITGAHIWADRYDGTLDDIFDLQDQITETVVGAMEPQLTRAEFERVRRKRTENPDSYDTTLRGLAHMYKVTPEDTARALELFRKAIAIDPANARASAFASHCYRRRVQISGMVLTRDECAEAVRLARAALEADPDDPVALWQAGMTTALISGDLEGGTALVERSLAINRNSPRAWIASSMIRCWLGDPDTAIEHAERAKRLSPRDPSAWVRYGVMANAHMQGKRYEDAAAWARKAIREVTDYPPPLYVLAASAAQLGNNDEALRAVERIVAMEPEMTITRLTEIYPVSAYANLDGFVEGLAKAGLPR